MCEKTDRIKGRITRKGGKGQASIMEYILLTFFVLVVILALLFFLSWWQFTQLAMEEHKLKTERIFFTARYVSSSPYFVKENSIFDDAKLTSMKTLGSSLCKDLETILGYDWFIMINTFDGDQDVSCNWNNYPNCNSWDLCTRSQHDKQNYTSRMLPVNIYKKISEENGVGTMEVGVYI